MRPATLQHLASSGPLTVGEAALHFDRSQGAMSELLQRLLDRGLVDRIADRRDRRRHLHWLSPAGERLLVEEQQVLCPQRLAEALTRLETNRRARLIADLEALVDAARSAARGALDPTTKQRKDQDHD